LGSAHYQHFATHAGHGDLRGVFTEFADQERLHARWYAEWLQAHGHAAPNPAFPDAVVLPGVSLCFAPLSLDRTLRTFAALETMAARQLGNLVLKVRDAELAAIMERTIPHEVEHALWYEQQGRRMLTATDLSLGKTRGSTSTESLTER
jgi:rubrerythrin